MSITIAERLSLIKPSPTLAVTARAAELQAQGLDIIGLGAGEPDFDTPKHICDAAIKAIESGFTRYTAVDGMASLKQAIVKKFKQENQLDYQANQIIVSCGAKQSLFNLMESTLNPGDEVIIPAPYWVSYPDMALLSGGQPVIIQGAYSNRYKITAKQLEQAITPKTRMFILNSPSNPTGVAYTKQELTELGEVLLRHPDVLVVSDDIYEHIIWDGIPFYTILNVCPALYDRTVVVNGVSKAYAMTGWRIGYAAGPQAIIKAMTKYQSQCTSNPNSIAQKAAQAALTGTQEPIKVMLTAFKARHDYVVARLQAMPGVKVQPADGAFYIFPDMTDVIARMEGIHNDVELSEYLLNKGKVAVVPGSAFGTPNCIRLSYATSMENLTKALDRIEQAIA